MPLPAGDIWPPALKLDDLPRAISEEWGLRLGERYAWARYSFAAPAGDAVLKISPPEDHQADGEAGTRVEGGEVSVAHAGALFPEVSTAPSARPRPRRSPSRR